LAWRWSELGAVDPRTLVEARLQAHHAAQWVTRAARANLAAEPDDSHSNFGWERRRRALISRTLVAADGSLRVAGLRLDRMALFLGKGARTPSEFALDGSRDAVAGAWIDRVAVASGLKPPSGVALPYEIPAHPVAGGAPYSCAAGRAEFAALAAWYAAAGDLLEETRSRLLQRGPGLSEVRCWPHHFDMATLLSLGGGGPDAMSSIGIGMSPGDDHYAQPYFYVSSWPVPAMASLPELPAPGHWHTVGFLGAVATAAEILALHQPRHATRRFIDGAIDACSRLLGKAGAQS